MPDKSETKNIYEKRFPSKISDFSRLLDSISQEKREELKSAYESNGKIDQEVYDLGQAGTDREKFEKVEEKESVSLYGSVDATSFKVQWHEPEWYKPYFGAAVAVLKCESLMNDSTKKWLDTVRPAVLKFAELDKFEAKDTKAEKKKYHSEIWSLVKKDGSNSIYGKKGVLNFLLAFRRITNIFPDLKKVKDADFDLKSLSIDEIGLSLGNGKGKEEGQKERWAYLVVSKEKEEQEEKEELPAGDAEAVSGEEGKVGAEEEAPESIADAEVDEGDVKEKKEIEKPTEEELKKVQQYLDNLEFEVDVSDKTMKFKLDDEGFWDKIKALEGWEKPQVISQLFEGKASVVHSLYIELADLIANYPEFFKNIDDEESIKMQKSYFYVVTRLLEAATKTKDKSDYYDDVYGTFHFVRDVDLNEIRDEEYKEFLEKVRAYVDKAEKVIEDEGRDPAEVLAYL